MIVNDIQQQLQLITTKSQELLTRLEYDINSDTTLAVDEINDLHSERSQLISNLFNKYSRDELQAELILINNILRLDSDLKAKTNELKQAFASKLIKIQKGKKSTSTYKKY